MNKISIREYDRLYNHFIKVPKPTDYYWQDTESNSSRIKFIKDIIINLEKNAYETKKPGSDILVRETT